MAGYYTSGRYRIFHEPQASENTAHECNIQVILHDQPLNVFILYLVNIIIILMNNDCLT